MSINEEIEFKRKLRELPIPDALAEIAWRTECIQKVCPECRGDINDLQTEQRNQLKDISLLKGKIKELNGIKTQKPTFYGVVSGICTGIVIGVIDYFRKG